MSATSAYKDYWIASDASRLTAWGLGLCYFCGKPRYKGSHVAAATCCRDCYDASTFNEFCAAESAIKLRGPAIYQLPGVSLDKRTLEWLTKVPRVGGKQLALDIETTTLPALKQRIPPACQCGAHAIGIKDRAPGHSSWCPMKGQS